MRDYFSSHSVDDLSKSRNSPKDKSPVHNPGFTVYRDSPVDLPAAEPAADPALVSQGDACQSLASEAPINPSAQLTTPQRKILYSAFTFSSPPKPTPSKSLSLVSDAGSSKKELA